MGLMERIADALGYERRDDALDPSWAAIGGQVGYASALSSRAAENLSAVLACVNVIGDSLGSIPAIVYKREAGSRIEQPTHPLGKLYRQGVTDAMTWPEFVAHLVASTLLTGNGLAAIERNGNGQLTGLRFIPWAHVTLSELSTKRLAYDVSDGLGNRRRYLAGEVIHLRDRTDDGLIGRSRLSRAADAVRGVELANTHAREFLAQGASPSGVVKYDGTLTGEQRVNLRDTFAERHSGARKAGSTIVLDGGMNWEAVQITPEDAELLATRKFGVEEICRIYQVPPPLIQDYSHNTFTNAETAGRWFAIFTLAPWARKIEAEFARSVFPASGNFELELDLSGFLRGDPKTRWDAHKIAVDTGVLDPEEIRQLEGWNPRGQEAA